MTLPSNPHILLSFINTKLRDQYTSLDALASDLDIDKDEIIKILETIDYFYDENNNQFK